MIEGLIDGTWCGRGTEAGGEGLRYSGDSDLSTGMGEGPFG